MILSGKSPTINGPHFHPKLNTLFDGSDMNFINNLSIQFNYRYVLKIELQDNMIFGLNNMEAT